MDGPGRFDEDTAVERAGDGFHAVLSPKWEVWGPFGGYVAAVALRALGAATPLRRPASFACAFLSAARFGPVDLDVRSLRRGKRTDALRVDMHQEGRPILSALGWAVDEGADGFVHDLTEPPAVPQPGALRAYAELAENYAEWYPLWRTIDAKPCDVQEAVTPSSRWRTWARLLETPSLADPWLDAARSLMWLDLMMWNAAVAPYTERPLSHIAPTLDLAATFHAPAPDDEWLLCDAHSPLGRDGLLGCDGRVWTPGGRLVATGVSTLFCRPNPFA